MPRNILPSPTCRVYCAVFGCLNSSLAHPNMTFFKLPANSERRREWLDLIHRHDLEDKNFSAYRICEKHFHAEDIRETSTRKLLTRNALPLLLLPNTPSSVPGGFRKEDKQTQVSLKIGVDSSTQTDEVYAQTSSCLSCITRRKRKLKADLRKSKKKIKQMETKTKK